MSEKILRAKAYWDNNYSVDGPDDFWTKNPLINEYTNRLVSGSPTTDMVTYVKSNYFPSCLPLGLSLGCGTGWLERLLIAKEICHSVDAVDLSENSIEEASRLSQKEGISKINYMVGDLNTMEFPENRYDAVFAGGILHHIENLEHLFAQIRSTLRNDGLFLTAEYIGPSRFQWGKTALQYINRILDIFPPELKINDRIASPTIDEVVSQDPSEAVRSDEIEGLIRKSFHILDVKYYNGTLLMPLYPALNANKLSAHDGPEAEALLRMAILIEEALVKENVLTPIYGLFVCRNIT
ncbi:MAG: methyltransferase domain-containing protein [Nitrospirae bacterium]|nr:methyltransferase domain-containing protein [Nitrospirota bacterium]